jgi:hypothetical protein
MHHIHGSARLAVHSSRPRKNNVGEREDVDGDAEAVTDDAANSQKLTVMSVSLDTKATLASCRRPEALTSAP